MYVPRVPLSCVCSSLPFYYPRLDSLFASAVYIVTLNRDRRVSPWTVGLWYGKMILTASRAMRGTELRPVTHQERILHPLHCAIPLFIALGLFMS